MADTPEAHTVTEHTVTDVAASQSVTNVAAHTVTDTVSENGPAAPRHTTPPEPWLDVDMEVRLHFGGREMQLSEALEIGPGTVLELDRHISDPVDLLVGDRIVARGEVVVLGGNFALQIAEVLPPQPRLESVRCLL